MKDIYIFSGLGADERVFQKLDFSGLKVTFIHWITPQKNEKIEAYAKRLTSQITNNKPVLIGLSFGGIMAVEVAKQIDTEKIILIASAKTKQEIPFYYRFAGKLSLHKLIPTKLMKQANFLNKWFFGTENKQDKQLLKEILRDTDPVFLKWAIDKIVHWNNETVHKNLIHIHGTKDRILPFRYISCDIIVKEGGHLMTVNKSEELSQILRSLLC